MLFNIACVAIFLCVLGLNHHEPLPCFTTDALSKAEVGNLRLFSSSKVALWILQNLEFLFAFD